MIPDSRYFAPIRQVLGLIHDSAARRRIPCSSAIASYLRELSYRQDWEPANGAGDSHHHRSDIHLLSWVAPASRLRTSDPVGTATALANNISAQLRHGDIVISTLRVLTLGNAARIRAFAAAAGGEPALQLMESARSKTSKLAGSGAPHDRILAALGLPHALLNLRPIGAGLVPMVDLAVVQAALQGISKVVYSDLVHAGDHLAVTDAGRLCPTFANFEVPPSVEEWWETMAALEGIHGMVAQLLRDDLFVPESFTPLGISDLLDEAEGLQRLTWRSARHLARRFAGSDEGFDPEASLAWLEIATLAQLAQIERLRRRHTAALRFAVGAVHMAHRFGPVPRDADTFKSLVAYLKGQGIRTPDLKYAVGGTPGWDEDRPCLALRAAVADRHLASALARLERGGLVPTGWGIGVSRMVREEVFEPRARAAAFRLLVRMGAIADAREFFHLPRSTSEKRPNADAKKGMRKPMAHHLRVEGALSWANAIAAVNQAAAPWLDRWQTESLKAGLRKFLQRLEGSERHLQRGELLFLNHVQIGLEYHSLTAHQMRYALRGSDRDPIEAILEAPVTSQTWATASLFRDSELSLGDTEVFASLMTDDGGSLKLLVFGPHGRYSIERPIESQIDTDWVQLLQRVARDVDSVYENVGVEDDAWRLASEVEIPNELSAVCEALVRQALEVNPNAQRIMLHADPMWNTVPWQFIHMCKCADPGAKLEALHRSGKRTVDRGLGRLAIWRVPGVQLGRAVSRAEVVPSEVKIDVSEPGFSTIKRTIETGREREGPRNGSWGLLSVLAHGQPTGSRVHFKVNGETVTAQDLAQFGKFRLVFLHVCNAAAVDPKFQPKIGDILGTPGEILRGGAWAVLAAAGRLSLAFFTDLEKYFYSYDPRTGDLGELEARYLHACLENPAVSLYTLFSGAIAPRLVQPNPRRA